MPQELALDPSIHPENLDNPVIFLEINVDERWKLRTLLETLEKLINAKVDTYKSSFTKLRGNILEFSNS